MVAPDPDQPEPANPRPFGLDDLSAPALVGWAAAVDDLAATVAGFRAAGYDPGDAVEMRRTAPNGDVLVWRLTLNAIAGGLLPFFIEWGDTPHPAASAPHGLTLRRFEAYPRLLAVIGGPRGVQDLT